MNLIRHGLVRTLVFPALFALASPLAAENGNDLQAYEQAIGQAKAKMMADSSAALGHAREAASHVAGDNSNARQARLTAKWLEAEALMRLNRVDEAAAIIENTIAETAKHFDGSKLHGDLLRSQASLMASQGEYGDALASFLEAHEFYESLGEERSRAIVLQNIGSLYSDARDYERVLSYYRQANEAYPDDVALTLSAHNNTGNALKELGRFEDAERSFRSALAAAVQMNSPVLEARIMTNIASVQFLSGDLAGAEATIRRGLAITHLSGPEWRPFLHGVRAQVALARGDHSTARSFIDRTFANEDIGSTSPFFRDFHETAYEVYSQSGNHQLAARHLEAFHRIDGQARELSSVANNALLAARFDSANRELEISKLSLEKEANEARLEAADNRVIMLSVVVALVILAFFAALFVLRMVNRSRRGIAEANARLTHVIQHDSLTELYAREHFRSKLADVVQNVSDAQTPPILAFIDLDRFKQVNDVFGHQAGDKLLAQVADRFRANTCPDTLIGRLGGDEFSMVMPEGTTMAQAIEQANVIIDAVAEPFEIDGFEITIGASIGLAPIDVASNTNVHMTNADLALYAAKDHGRGTCVVYSNDMRERLEDRSSLEKDLEAALKNDQLSIAFQPIVRSEGRAVMCYEALMRWSHPERGIVPPSQFIPVAEESRLIDRLGSWMLRNACAKAVTWPEDVKLTVNVSTLQMNDPNFLNVVAQALAFSGLQPNRLVLELTESLVLEMDDELEKLLVSLRALGVSFALDDFGRGYSSLNYIDKMDFSMIKIDRDFVQSAAAGSQRSQAVVAAIVALAQSLEIDVTAEGIEEEDQADAMAALGCSCFQGFHFGRPAHAKAPGLDDEAVPGEAEAQYDRKAAA